MPVVFTAPITRPSQLRSRRMKAAQAVSGSTATRGNEISVWEANPLIEFRAQTQGATLQSSSVGKTKAIVWDSTLTIHKVDLSNSTLINVRVVVTQLIDNIGDSGGAVAFRFLAQTPPAGDSTVSRSVLAFYGRG